MNLFTNASERRKPQDVVGLDFSVTGVKAVRMKRVGDQLTLTGAAMFPPGEGGALVRPDLGKTFTANYAALAITAPTSVVRVVAHAPPQYATQGVDEVLRQQIGLDESYRLSSIPSGQQVTKGKNEQRTLVAAITNADARAVLNLFREGAPAPCSLEISSLASLNAAVAGPVAREPGAPVCLLDCGARVSMMVFINNGAVILARKLDVGGEAVAERVQRQLGVERDMAESIMGEGAIDISQAVREVSDPFLRQVMISRDFVERQENCRVTTAYITGGLSMSSYWIQEIRRQAGMTVKTWDPLEGINVSEGAISAELRGQICRFSAAIGAARGVLDQS